jgi:hypothetical protein
MPRCGMAKPNIVARVHEGDRLECVIVPEHGERLILAGPATAVQPTVEESSPLETYPAIVDNAWAFAKYTYLKVNLPSHEEQQLAAKNAKAHKSVTEWMVALADEPATVTRHDSWCSSCFTNGDHQKVKVPIGQLPAYLCRSCGTPTLPCAAKGCDHMAVRKRGPVRMPRFCAEHRHDIPGFRTAQARLDSLAKYEEIFEYEQPNLAKIGKLGGTFGVTALTVGATVATLGAAPAIGGAVGTVVSSFSFTTVPPLYGAAATSYGLALLGGSFGMAGGTVVVTAVGGALGGVLGSSVMNAYVREDSSFRIEELKDGTGTPVIVCNGFLSENGDGWGEWRDIVTKRYPDSPVFRVHWGAKELRSLGLLASSSALKSAGAAQIQAAATAATKAGAKKLGPLAPALVAAGMAKNPWHVARSRANKTGVIVADLLARTQAESYVLVGHSLGARAMAVAAQTLGTNPNSDTTDDARSPRRPRLEAVHLLGAAINHRTDAETLTARVDDAVYNYYSSNDNVLKFLYSAAEAGQKAAGLRGFEASADRLKNANVSDVVAGHSDYQGHVDLL